MGYAPSLWMDQAFGRGLAPPEFLQQVDLSLIEAATDSVGILTHE